MKKKNIVKSALVCGGIATIGYLAKKIYDVNEELNNIKIDNLTKDIFESDIPKSENEKRIFTRENTTTSIEKEEVIKDETPKTSVEERPIEAVTEENTQIPQEVLNKILKLEDTLTYEELAFNSAQRDYLCHIIEYMKKNHEMRMALLISLDYNGKNPLEVFTDDQFARIKRVLQ